MKKGFYFFIAALAAVSLVLSSGCTSASENLPSSAETDSLMQEALFSLQGSSYSGTDTMLMAAKDCALYAQSPELESKMSDTVSENDCILTVLYIGNDNIIKSGYPEIEGISAGNSLKSDDTVVLMNKNKIPTLTSLFELKQGGYGAAVYYPVFLNESYQGFISIAFSPEKFFSRYAQTVRENYGFEVMVLQKDGVMLYDPDETETGTPTFNNPVYDDFPGIIEAAEKVVKDWSGSCEYSYYATGTRTEVKKKAFWSTLAQCGNEWRLMVIKNINSG